MKTRFFFEPPRRQKPKTANGMKSLLIRCPSTSKLIDTGKSVEEKRWATTKLKLQKFTCSHCGSVHSWTKGDVILARPVS
jgi:5-methylcytosine-specific restriction endonuclease McrA